MECGSSSSRLFGFVVLGVCGKSGGKESRELKLKKYKAKAGAAAPALQDEQLKMSNWPHSPMHRLAEAGAYMVTGGTYLKLHHFRGNERLCFLCDSLLSLAAQYEWNLQAWAVFSNHYHFVALSPAQPESLRELIRKLHSDTAFAANQWEGAPGRQVWFQYRDTHLTYPKSYFARLSYVHRNAVHHKLVREPSLYPWCSAGWLQRRAPTSFCKTIMGFGIERLNVPDDFEVEWSPDDK